MTITRERFDMALSRLTSADWEQFERLASTFLVSDYPSLRTMASPSGDGGRDSELYGENEDRVTVMQYSVTEKWSKKIRETATRLKETFPDVRNLIYLTNQLIGARGDNIKKELRMSGVYLDIRDRSWFLDRVNLDRSREQAAENLAKRFVDPLLPSGEVDRNLVTGLESGDAKIALLYLEMQIQDSDRALGLTKASYDTLTLAALRDTNTSKRSKREAIYSRVQGFLPSHPAAQIRMKVDASLKRLTQKAIRHRKDADEFHLLDSEQARITNSVARIDGLRRDFEADISDILALSQDVEISDSQLFVYTARKIIENYFLKKGENFAKAVIKSEPHRIDETTLRSVALGVVDAKLQIKGRSAMEFMLSVINTLFSTPSEATSAYLNLLLESYTLFAFLASTPDVQKVTQSMFGSGEIWLDTSIILPLLAESAMPEGKRPFREMFAQARKAGVMLFVTQGVLEEVERHINRSKAYVRVPSWSGDVPFLFSAYALAGKAKDSFMSWLENFIGDIDPLQDIADYLQRYHNVGLESAAEHSSVSAELAEAIRNVWQEVHAERRGQSDPQHLFRLAAHDSETYLHVLSSRISQRGKSPLGYTRWWLTLDSKARGIMDRVEPSIRPSINIGPVLSIDFLIRYLAFGPNRERVDVSGAALARVYADTLVEPIPIQMMEIVNQIRIKHADLTDNVVQRRIRDTLNQERSKEGLIGSGGLINSADVLDTAY